ncbi:structural polyprotein [Anopheles C virus]|uniref:structural polyprotein n=1 Tax=Anopheles C virus TaxID=1769780 RepID=UPI0007C0ED40|nr:structural polyprotein [Anopheles C virus]ALS55296.1 structural polyprotein [Anopheles C virus]
MPLITPLDQAYLAMTTREERIHTIKDFLSRPIRITSNLWSETNTQGQQLFSANFPEVLIANPMFRSKVEGFVGLRANMRVKLQVNSQPFQQGRLLMHYIPYAQYMPNKVSMINYSLHGKTGCPRVDLDLSVGTEIEMLIPYVSPHAYYNLVTGQGSFGAIYLTVYSQLRDPAAANGSVEYTIWAYLEDVDIQYPTGANVYTGSAPNRATLAKEIEQGLDYRTLRKALVANTYGNNIEEAFAQMGPEIKEIKEQGTISKGLGQLGTTLSTFSSLPILGPYLRAPAWLSKAASNVAMHLGFSKPSVQGIVEETKLRTAARMANFNGVDSSYQLGLSASNEIQTVPGLSGSKVDEMDLNVIASIPNYWSQFSWSVTDSTNKVLWDNYVTPYKIKQEPGITPPRFVCTFLGFLANMFAYWRGSLVYTFKFVKTNFHSGRLQISFIPFYFNSTISTGVPDTTRAQRIIVDLRTATEVSFTVPYVSSRPWMFCARTESEVLGTVGTDMYNAVLGIIRVEVLNQLVASNSVTQSIDVLVEVNGGPDLTFAGPGGPSYRAYSGSTTVADESKALSWDGQLLIKPIETEQAKTNEVKKEEASAQMMGDNEQTPRNEAQLGAHSESIDTHPIQSNWSPEALCIGEKITSVRQLIKRHGLLARKITLNQANPTLFLAPFAFRNPPSATLATSSPTSLLEYFHDIYAFYRGGIRHKIVAEGAPNFLVSMVNTLQEGMIQLLLKFNWSAFSFLRSTFPANLIQSPISNTFISTPIEGAMEIQVPYYNSSHISPCVGFSAGTTSPISRRSALLGFTPPVIVGVTPMFPPGETDEINCAVSRAAADDFSFSYILGPPPLVPISFLNV